MKQLLFGLKPSILSVALSLVLLTACMPSKQVSEQWLQDKDLVIQSLQDAHMNNAKLKESIEELDSRLLSLEATNSKQQAKIAAMEASLAKAKLVPSQSRKKKSSQKKRSLNKRLDALSAKLNPPATSSKNQALAEKNAYTAAYLALKSGRYDESSTGFSSVIKSHPDGQYTDQAYYWLGESLLAQHQSKQAIKSFAIVSDKYPDSPKHAAALLKLASTYANSKRVKDSKRALKRVIKEHPDSRSAERARTLLANMAKGAGAKK